MMPHSHICEKCGKAFMEGDCITIPRVCNYCKGSDEYLLVNQLMKDIPPSDNIIREYSPKETKYLTDLQKGILIETVKIMRKSYPGFSIVENCVFVDDEEILPNIYWKVNEVDCVTIFGIPIVDEICHILKYEINYYFDKKERKIKEESIGIKRVS